MLRELLVPVLALAQQRHLLLLLAGAGQVAGRQRRLNTVGQLEQAPLLGGQIKDLCWPNKPSVFIRVLILKLRNPLGQPLAFIGVLTFCVFFNRSISSSCFFIVVSKA